MVFRRSAHPFITLNETHIHTILSTPFGLYRDGTELRGVYYEHPAVGRAACNFLGDQCDFPILLGMQSCHHGEANFSQKYGIIYR